MDRSRSPVLQRDGLTVSYLMSQVRDLCMNAEALATLGSLGGAEPGERNPAVLQAWAFTYVKNMLGEEMRGEGDAFSPEAKAALRSQGLDNPEGRTLVRVYAAVSGREADQLALQLTADPDVLLVQLKCEQYRSLAEQGRLDVVDPQFRADPAFLPYVHLWEKVKPETREHIVAMQQQWAKLAEYWQAFLTGQPLPPGPPPADPFGVRDSILRLVEKQAIAELTLLREELETGMATVPQVQEHLARLDRFDEVLGEGWMQEKLASVFGEQASRVDAVLTFRENFLKGKAEYWHRVIKDGEEAANRWDAEFYQPLRDFRDANLQDPVFGVLVEAIQAEAVSLHDAYAMLYRAKQGWWQAYFQGQPTERWEQQGAEARALLVVRDPGAEVLWRSDNSWHLDREKGAVLAEFGQAYEAYWRALLNCDRAALAEAESLLAALPVAVASRPGRRIAEQFEQRLQEEYLAARQVLAESRSSIAVVERATAALAFWREHLDPALVAQWDALAEARFRPQGPVSREELFPGAGRLLEPSPNVADIWEKEGREIIERVNRYDSVIRAAAAAYNLDPLLIKAVITRESKGHPDARGGSGDTGLMQIVWNLWGYSSPEPLLDPVENIWKGAQILRYFIDYFDGDVRKGIQAYNYGQGNVLKAIQAARAAGRPEEEWTSFRSVVKGGNPRYLEDVIYFYERWAEVEGRSVTQPQRSPESAPPLRIVDQTHRVHPANYTVANRTRGDITHVVIHHISAGGTEAALSHWSNDVEASAHYIVDHDGVITRAVAEKNIAYHAGGINKSSAPAGLRNNPWVQDAGYMNRRSIGIELQNDDLRTPFSGNWETLEGVEFVYTEKQLRQTARLVADILHRYGLEPTREYLRDANGNLVLNPDGKPFVDLTRSTVVGHGDFLNKSGKYNEPRNFPWDRFMEMVREEYAKLR